MNNYLEGIRVLDFSRYIAGPFAGLLLADLGADVIKVEKTKTGDDTRVLGPWKDGVSLYYPGYNRGKRSVTVNFRDPRGIELLKSLIKESDVIVENFRTGTMAKMGLDYETIKAINPKIIMASVTGFGQTGPYANRAAFDQIISAMGGLMREDSTGRPIRANGPVADTMGAMYAVIAILCALRERDVTGLGQHIDVSMFAGAVTLKNNELGFCSAHNKPAPKAHADSAPSGPIHVKDGWVSLHAGTDPMWQRYKTFTKDPVALDPKYDDVKLRVEEADMLLDRIEQEYKDCTCEEVEEIFSKAGIPVGIVMDGMRLLKDKHLRENKHFVRTEIPGAGYADYAGLPFKSSTHDFSTTCKSAALGEHNQEIYSTLAGLTEEEIEALRKDGVI